MSCLSYDVWIEPLEAIGIEQNLKTGDYSLVLQVATFSVLNHVKKQYSNIILESIRMIDDNINSIIFRVQYVMYDDDFKKAVRVAIRNNGISVALIQRHLNIGYSNAARIMDSMEDMKFVSPMECRKLRDVYID